MVNEVSANTLRDWLEQGRKVTVLDIRNDEDRTQWAIPGSVHINAYDALRNGRAGRSTGCHSPCGSACRDGLQRRSHEPEGR